MLLHNNYNNNSEKIMTVILDNNYAVWLPSKL